MMLNEKGFYYYDVKKMYIPQIIINKLEKIQIC